MHRFAALWTGDNASQWEFYRINVAQVLALGISGQSLVGQETGGFEKGEDWEMWCDPQLFMRWMCTSALLPWFRNHYKGIAKGGKQFQEPYQFQHVKEQTPFDHHYLYESVLPVTRHYVELRYRLMQLFYDALFENTLTGLPIVRALFINDPDDRALYNDRLEFLDNEFFIRKDLLIAPVTQAQNEQNGLGRRDIYLPAGSSWYAFMDNRKKLGPAVSGGTTIMGYDARIDGDPKQIPFAVPIYIRAGAVLPTIELEQYVGERDMRNEENPVTLNVYPGDSGQYVMYLDDGVSRSSAWTDSNNPGVDPLANDEYRKVEIRHETLLKIPLIRQITVARLHQGYIPRESYYFVAVLHDPGALTQGGARPIDRITRNGQLLSAIEGNVAEERADRLARHDRDAYYYNENIHITFIKVFDTADFVSLTLEYCS
jgi:alpha-glucosidase